MKTTPVLPADLARSVIAVPPIARRVGPGVVPSGSGAPGRMYKEPGSTDGKMSGSNQPARSRHAPYRHRLAMGR